MYDVACTIDANLCILIGLIGCRTRVSVEHFRSAVELYSIQDCVCGCDPRAGLA
jgi:hypothetical protein